jgi:DNA repair ATPase RecN
MQLDTSKLRLIQTEAVAAAYQRTVADLASKIAALSGDVAVLDAARKAESDLRAGVEKELALVREAANQLTETIKTQAAEISSLKDECQMLRNCGGAGGAAGGQNGAEYGPNSGRAGPGTKVHNAGGTRS